MDGDASVDRQGDTCILSGVGDLYKALADPTRRTILDELTERDGQTLFEICSRLVMKHGIGASRQAISQHLDVLEESASSAPGDRADTSSTPSTRHRCARSGSVGRSAEERKDR